MAQALKITGIALLLTCVALGSVVSAQNSPRSPEYLIKAAYLYNFAMFVEWPADAFATPDAPLVIGIVGADPFGWALERTVQDKRINRHRIVIERLQPQQDVRHCHIVFVATADGGRTPELQRSDSAPILIVADSAQPAKVRSAINFLVKNDQVTFEVDLDAARSARVVISSKLLKLARIVRGS